MMLVRKGEWIPVLFDGLRTEELRSKAIPVLKHLASHYDVNDLPQKGVMWGSVPHQSDSWSCGHRMVVVLRYLLDLGIEPGEDGSYQQQLDLLEIPDHVVGAESLSQHCPTEERASSRMRVKTETMIKVKAECSKMKRECAVPIKKQPHEPLEKPADLKQAPAMAQSSATPAHVEHSVPIKKPADLTQEPPAMAQSSATPAHVEIKKPASDPGASSHGPVQCHSSSRGAFSANQKARRSDPGASSHGPVQCHSSSRGAFSANQKARRSDLEAKASSNCPVQYHSRSP